MFGFSILLVSRYTQGTANTCLASRKCAITICSMNPACASLLSKCLDFCLGRLEDHATTINTPETDKMFLLATGHKDTLLLAFIPGLKLRLSTKCTNRTELTL